MSLEPQLKDSVSWATAQEFVKDVPELSIKGSVDDGVDSTVDITKPCDNADQCWPNVTWLAQYFRHVDYKEGRPTGKKHA